MSKKEIGNAINGLLDMILDLYESKRDESLNVIIHTLNLTDNISRMYAIREIDDVRRAMEHMNDLLEDDGSFYRIASHRGKYQLARII